MKLKAAQKKEVAARVKAAKQSDGKVTWQMVRDAILVDGMFDAVGETVYDELRAWSTKCEQQYSRIVEDCDRIGQTEGIYLTDQNVDEENVLVAGRTVDSVDFWCCMAGALGPTAGDRAELAGIDLNARLGYIVY